MGFSKVFSAQTTALEVNIIDIEVDLSKGLHSFSVVGLAGKSVEESRDRVGAAIKNSGFKSPKNKNQKVVVSLAPADLKKEGPVFDLAIAVAYLLSSKDINFNPDDKLFLGELSLDGNLRKITGVLPLVRWAKIKGFKEVFLPKANAKEAALIDNIKIFGAESLKEVVDHLNTKNGPENKKSEGEILKTRISVQPKTKVYGQRKLRDISFSDIKGQEGAKRAMVIAAAGKHNILMYGPPGTGKTMLAKAFCQLLPDLSFEEMLEATAIHSVAGKLGNEHLVLDPPFRSPHHTSSHVSLIGGGAIPKPGEVTLAHKGVLFLDEFPEFDRRVIDSLREPLEERAVNVSRASGSAIFPANFTLVAAMNPCPCGNFGIKGKECLCTPINIERYKRKISGPMVDRIDLWAEVSRVDHKRLSENGPEKSDEVDGIRERIIRARKIQEERLGQGKLAKTNSEMSPRDIVKLVSLEKESVEVLNESAEKLDLSARSYHRIIKISQTVADLEGSSKVSPQHILEALQYRPRRSMVNF